MEEINNHTTVSEFILAGLTDNPELQLPLFLIFLALYVVTVVGNLGMIILILFSSQLHTPMYYLLSSLSFIDCCQSTVITPKMLVNFVAEKNVIPHPECIAQFFFYCAFVVAECHMLAAMAYDRYVAISNPLLYNVAMSYQVCLLMVAVVYAVALFSATVHTVLLIRVVFCKADIIKHYFCDIVPLLDLSCSDTYINEVVLLSFSAFNIIVPTMIILSSYIFIIVSILHIQSTGGRAKAFSTCSSHILAVAIFYGSAAFMYLQSSSVSLIDQGKVSSVFYTIVVPMLNPMIYSLRNKDVKVALKKLLQRIFPQNREQISLAIEYNFCNLEEDIGYKQQFANTGYEIISTFFLFEKMYQSRRGFSDS
ncbi:LOW QUALITY PROTEIN: olfactory receptor 150-like [Acomys russatus]|uniref:LOW QUALITY PROTEIN: olfactory receptor 150-like n=1 Tax=Acomys russatus TaxID=60746 RepID=UPI0021E21F60|nr:LOW QUALITY PROTEIN: olfactory receptor 150-like [Acomys russatus]